MHLQRVFRRLVYHFRRLFFPVVQYRLAIFLMLIFASISLLISLSSPQPAEMQHIPDQDRASKQYSSPSMRKIKRNSFDYLPESLMRNFTAAGKTTRTRRKSWLTTDSIDRKLLWNSNQTTGSKMNQLEVLTAKSIKPSLALNESMATVVVDPATRYSFIDIRSLGVQMEYLDQVYQPPSDLLIEYPSSGTHYLSRIITVKGDPSLVFYNRMPHCHEFTMHYLMQNVSFLHSFSYVSSEIYTPFTYDSSSLLTIARSLLNEQRDRLFYDRHIHFFDYYALQLPKHPVWINLVKDPIYRIAIEYQRSREICRTSTLCFVQKDLLNDTLDQCVLRRSPRECISIGSGISRMLPFFCGLRQPTKCLEETDWALQQAKENIDFYYTVVGFAEDFYKFLYVLEKLLPQYFKLARLIFMNQWDPRKLADARDINVPQVEARTAEILRPLLHYEYQLYEFVKQRFFEQYHILVELDN